MSKLLIVAFYLMLTLLLPSKSLAQENSFVSVVNPIRGEEFWNLDDEQVEDSLIGQKEILNKFNIPATYLVRFDALINPKIIDILKSLSIKDEIGLFLEITPKLTQQSAVVYNQTSNWYSPGSVFLTGYSPQDRIKLIDTAFEKFKSTFDYYPKSVGAWWIDSFSLSYMQQKYGIDANLVVADQFSTDDYQIWGQYFSTPYYSSTRNGVNPAQTLEHKIPVVTMQWAARDPINGFGKGVEESTFSIQANDYIDYHDLDANYFDKLVDIYTKQKLNEFNHLVVGLENSYSWKKYQSEYQKQIEILYQKQSKGQFKFTLMKEFASWYKQQFPQLSPPHFLIANDPLGSEKVAVWFMNHYYRAGWISTGNESKFRDLRQYAGGDEEPCLNKACNKLNFATFAVRVLDEVTYGDNLAIDKGAIDEVKAQKKGEGFIISYKNDAARNRSIEFLLRDIGIDGKTTSIDSTILLAHHPPSADPAILESFRASIEFSFIEFVFKLIKFILFILLGLFVPGFIFVQALNQRSLLFNFILSIACGLVILTLISYIASFISTDWLVEVFIIFNLLFFLIRKLFLKTFAIKFSKVDLLIIIVILLGTIFQSLPLIRSGLAYDFGIGFWGPLGHDGIWHQSLINQLILKSPPENPIFSDTKLTNYHYFYDLLIAQTAKLTNIEVIDLLYRFFPTLFSLLLGILSFIWVELIFNKKFISLLTLYFVYFAGSFGWIVEYIKEGHFGGESAFWVNQPVSFNLNPPLMISLVILMAIILIFYYFIKQKSWTVFILLAFLIGSMLEFKAYGGIVVLGSLFLVAIFAIFNKNFQLIKLFFASSIVSLITFYPNIKSGDLIVFSPFWFIHSMIDFPDRVGWTKLSQARSAYFERGEWLKFILAEALAFSIFIVGNLGTRFITLFSLFYFITKKLWSHPFYLFVVLMAFISLTIPIIFIQKGNPWNTIQFFYYFLFICSLFSGAAIYQIYKILPKLLNLVVIGILVITPINAVTTFRSAFYENPPARLTWGEFEALNFLKQQQFGVILTHPYENELKTKFKPPFPLVVYETTAYVSAFSAKPTYLEDEIQLEILQTDYQKRLVESHDFFRGRESPWSKNFLSKNNISYIYLPNIYKISLDQQIGIEEIFSNSEVKIYKVV